MLMNINNKTNIKTQSPSIKGKMIFFDGPDGSGKSTQIKITKEYLESKGYEVLQLRQPGMPGEHGDNMRDMLFGKDRYYNFWSTRLLFAAEYIEFMERYGYIKDKVVICDRCVLTSNVCIGGAEYGNLSEVIDELKRIHDLAPRKPDTIFIYSVNPYTVRHRLQSRLSEGGDMNHYDMKEQLFHTRSCENFDRMEEIDEKIPALLGLDGAKKTIYTIDANKNKEAVTKATIDLLNDLYDI